MSHKKYGVVTPRVKNIQVPTIKLVYPVADTLEALEQDYMDIGYSSREAAVAARRAFEYDSK